MPAPLGLQRPRPPLPPHPPGAPVHIHDGQALASPPSMMDRPAPVCTTAELTHLRPGGKQRPWGAALPPREAPGQGGLVR